MNFLISGTHISPIYLVVVGFFIGILGGFFGVGGSFLAGPALFAVGVPMNFVVGTDLAHIVGKSIVAAKRHRALGNVDIKLGLIMVIGTIAGVELGAQIVQQLKRHAYADIVLAISFTVVLLGISAFMGWEGWQTWKQNRHRKPPRPSSTRKLTPDPSAISHITKWIQQFHIPPMISLPNSGIKEISLWTILAVAFVGGLFSGFLGGGAGYIRMPALVYLLGVPTHVAVGTDLFEVVISASYGTFTHALKGNVDILIALVMHTGAAIGAQIGATLTQYFHGTRIRLAFVPLPLLGAAIIIYSLITGHH
ncbi:MAG TPA: sulfite exporter TauE/SafE family protein [Verrucomicrobiae bacterium]|nr:sulfite exporter TauE/SafE family protein [Verrucomicrobiae bacterium]